MAYRVDRAYKYLFSHPEIVRQLLTGFVELDVVKDIDWDSLESFEKSFVSEEFKARESDLVWKVRLSGKDLYIYLLIEFQSTVDRFMSLRMLRYICELYQTILKQEPGRKTLPAILPISTTSWG